MPRRVPRRSLSRKYTIFTGLLLVYIVFVFLAYDILAGSFNPVKATALCLGALLCLGAIAKYTNRVLARPLHFLEKGITSVRQGRLEPIQVSRTGDEVEFVGESFNAMIEDLAASRNEIHQYQESLEQRIRQRTRDLEKASKKAVAASQAKSEFLANMSHELRTPMSGVLGMIDIVLDSKLAGEQHEQLVTAKGCANTLLALLNDILDLSKIEAGKMVLEDVPFSPRAVARECIKSLGAKVERKGIAIRSVVSRSVPESIAGDPLRVRQILTNLLGNAVKFTSEGWVEVRLDTGIVEATGARTLITGAGIAPEKLPTIFDEFTQADGSISRKYGGTGLGLAITRSLVEIHDGQISVSSKPGRGSTFRVVLPCTVVSEASARVKQRNAASTAPAAVDTGPDSVKSILVVEDNPVNQKIVAAILKKRGYRVEIANHGGEALPGLDRSEASLVLMDIQMPIVDGLEATRMIRLDSRWKDVPIVAMTAHAMTGDRDRCLKAGMDAYLSKPVNRQQLIAVVEKHIRERTHASGNREAGMITAHSEAVASCPFL